MPDFRTPRKENPANGGGKVRKNTLIEGNEPR